MKCMKSELLSILPQNIRSEINDNQLLQLQEIRMRVGLPAKLISNSESVHTHQTVSQEDLRFTINAASKYSPWNATSIKEGYLTAPGGHRIGLCGEAASETIRTLTSLCIRISRDIPILGNSLTVSDSTLIIGPPGSGKTTLLRCLIRRLSWGRINCIAVADDRCEIFPIVNGQYCFDPGPNTDVLSGKSKADSIVHLLRSLGPEWIAADEITAQADCDAMLKAGWCGVKLLATAHAGQLSDLYDRLMYRPLLDTGLFHHVIVMRPDKSYYSERI